MTQNTDEGATGSAHICPARHGWVLGIPLRRLIHRPEAILAGLVRPGQTAVDLGCGPGFFTVPMARMVGPEGRVLAVDLQQGMLDRLRANAERAGVLDRISLHRAEPRDLGVQGKVDFALAFYMVHEVPDPRAFLAQVAALLAPDGRFLVSEPHFHVSAARYRAMVALAGEVGLRLVAEPRIAFSRSALFAPA